MGGFQAPMAFFISVFLKTEEKNQKGYGQKSIAFFVMRTVIKHFSSQP